METDNLALVNNSSRQEGKEMYFVFHGWWLRVVLEEYINLGQSTQICVSTKIAKEGPVCHICTEGDKSICVDCNYRCQVLGRHPNLEKPQG